MKHKPVWWQTWPALLLGASAGVTALGALIVKSSVYIQLPVVMAEEVKRNDSQDARLDKLITIQELQQKATVTEGSKAESIRRSEEVADDGEVKSFLMDGKRICCNGTDPCWDWNKKTKCAR